MTTSQRLDRQTLERILQANDVEALPFSQLLRLFRQEEAMAGFLPDGLYQVDPRNGDPVLYNSSRARRPHDNHPPAEALGNARDCAICRGDTTGVVDVAGLSEGFTFINKNLFPALFPFDPDQGRPARGLHFLQWTSSLHDRDWHNVPPSDLSVVMGRLAALERKLLVDSAGFMPEMEAGGRGFVSIIKNYGQLVGGSLAHGHQQITFGNVMPRRVEDHVRFQKERGEPFSAYLLRENPADLTVAEYGPALLVVPYFMKRPYDMMLLVRDTGKKHLYELNEEELAAVSRGWHDATRAIHHLLPTIGRQVAYNALTHNGPGAGLYFEFLPYTQEDGGLEKLGLYVCQQQPAMAAAHIDQLLRET